MINPKLSIGDRIVLLQMDDKDPIEFGTKGEVLGISKVFGEIQYKVKWENGRTLQILADVDKWMKEEDFNNLKNKKKKM
jgi:hypothetical protein